MTPTFLGVPAKHDPPDAGGEGQERRIGLDPEAVPRPQTLQKARMPRF